MSHTGAIHHNIWERTWETIESNTENTAGIFNESITHVVGCEKVVGIVSDNESKMRLVWDLVERDNPGLTALPFAAHIANLLMKDIGHLGWIARVISNVKKIVVHVLNHNFPLAPSRGIDSLSGHRGTFLRCT